MKKIVRPLVKGLAKVTWGLTKATWEVGSTAAEATFWAGHVGKNAVVKSVDLYRACRTMTTDALVCPKGHTIPTTGVFECRACGFVYQGSAFQCQNPECRATTSYLNCPECHLSVRNPFRWGRS